MTHRPKHVQHSPVRDLARLSESQRGKFRELGSLQEHGHRVASTVRADNFTDFDGVVSQKVVDDQSADIAEHGRAVVPLRHESENVTVVLKKLLELVQAFVRA